MVGVRHGGKLPAVQIENSGFPRTYYGFTCRIYVSKSKSHDRVWIRVLSLRSRKVDPD